MRLFPFLCVALFLGWFQVAQAAQKSVTFYLDGATVEQEKGASKGYFEHVLPDSWVAGSLRVKPVGRGSVLRVEVVPPERDKSKSREIARLEERKSELQDRLQTLAKREEIFGAAVRSQSGKTPRKSKTNPDPLTSLQQGTSFALGQLDSVNRTQRSVQRSLDDVERRLSAAKKGSAVARVWLTAKKARISYRVSNDSWSPCYDFRWSGDATGELLLHAKLPRQEKGVQYLVSQGTVAQGVAPQPVQGEFPTLYRCPLKLQTATATDKPPLSFTFAPVEASLPPGEAAAFWRGEYLGTGRFAGGGAADFSVGSR